MSHPNETWSEADKERLRALWIQQPPLSTREIGLAMGLSKNQVVGKAHRLKLPARPSPIGVHGPAHPGFRGGRKPKPRPAMAAAVPRLAPPPPAPVAPPRPSGRTCQWIYGEPAGKATRFCDAPGLRGSAYCAAHHALCHTTPAYWLAA
jgi:GcrA cell cycle regulator